MRVAKLFFMLKLQKSMRPLWPCATMVIKQVLSVTENQTFSSGGIIYTVFEGNDAFLCAGVF